MISSRVRPGIGLFAALLSACGGGDVQAPGPTPPPPPPVHPSTADFSFVAISPAGAVRSQAIAASSTRWVVGVYRESPTAQDRAFAWSEGSGSVDMGTREPVFAFVADVNSAGVAVGSDRGPFRWTLEGGLEKMTSWGNALPWRINDDGWVVGGPQVPFLFTPEDGFQQLGSLGGVSGEAQVLNNQGVVAGLSLTADSVWRPFIWTESEGMVDPGDLGGVRLALADVNDHNQFLAAREMPDGSLDVLVWDRDSGEVTVIPHFGGHRVGIWAINNDGWVGANGSDERGPQALLWLPEGRWVRMPIPPGWSLPGLMDLSDRGDVVGSARDEDGVMHAVLWKYEP